MKYAEDYPVGAVYDLGSHKVTADEIVKFAQEYDPQPYHLSEEGGRASSFGGLIASGWNTASIWMMLYVTTLLPGSSIAGSPGVDELRFLRPVRPGDELFGKAEVIGAVSSLTNYDILTVRNKGSLTNGEGKDVLTLILNSRFRRRPTES
ncbi:MAG: MaoC/PaaZ C-terminal domain-containing protein [Streptosporangiaceae bacterium]